MIYLRARFYEPEMNRFGQKDLLRGSAFVPQSLNRYVYCWNDPVDYIDPSGQLGLLAGTAIAAGICGLVAGATSAYQSYKSTGKVDMKQAVTAAAGGALAAVAVGVAVATGGTGLGVATMAVEAIAGGRTALRGGSAADVTTAMAKAGTTAVVAGNLMPVLPATVKVGLGAAGMAGSAIKLNNDLKTAKQTFSDPSSKLNEKIVSALDAGIDFAALGASAAMIAQNLKPAANELKQAYNGAKQFVTSIKQAFTSPKTPTVESTQAGGQAAGCSEGGSERPTWRQSEIDTGSEYPDYREQVSFLDGNEVNYGTEGSVRPDFYRTGSSLEVKNYDITSTSGRNRLVSVIAEQYKQRVLNLPEGTTQTVLIDIRGQSVSDAVINELHERIMQATGDGVSILFRK